MYFENNKKFKQIKKAEKKFQHDFYVSKCHKNIVDTAFKNYYGQTNIEKKLRRELMYVSKTF